MPLQSDPLSTRRLTQESPFLPSGSRVRAAVTATFFPSPPSLLLLLLLFFSGRSKEDRSLTDHAITREQLVSLMFESLKFARFPVSRSRFKAEIASRVTCKRAGFLPGMGNRFNEMHVFFSI